MSSFTSNSAFARYHLSFITSVLINTQYISDALQINSWVHVNRYYWSKEELNPNPSSTFFEISGPIAAPAALWWLVWMATSAMTVRKRARGGTAAANMKVSIRKKWATWPTNACCISSLLMWEEEDVSTHHTQMEGQKGRAQCSVECAHWNGY